MSKFNLLILEQTEYQEALRFQEALFSTQLKLKAEEKKCSNHLIFLEHFPVYTLGKSGKKDNLLVDIDSTDASFYVTTRGGDITYHGTGQLTGYPIFNLETFGIGVREYVAKIEQCIINCIADYGVLGERISEASGVWVDVKNNPRKICAIGIKVSRGISMHGFAFNINTNLNYFKNIVPCGLTDKGVTSLEKEIGKPLNMLEVYKNLFSHFEKQFC